LKEEKKEKKKKREKREEQEACKASMEGQRKLQMRLSTFCSFCLRWSKGKGEKRRKTTSKREKV